MLVHHFFNKLGIYRRYVALLDGEKRVIVNLRQCGRKRVVYIMFAAFVKENIIA
jgi:hypothetical protein